MNWRLLCIILLMMVLWSGFWCTWLSRLAVTALTKNACQIRTPWFTSRLARRWKSILKIRDMGFLRNNLIYLTREEIAKQIHGLRYIGDSLRWYFPYLMLQSVPKLLTVTAVFQLLQITSWGFSSSFPWDNFMYKYVINLIENEERNQCYVVGLDPDLL